MEKPPPVGRVARRGTTLALALASCCPSAAASAAAAANRTAPNILLLFPDQWRYDWAGFHPEAAHLEVPTLRRLAAEGTRYTYAYTPAPWCMPARACMASVKRYGNKLGSAPNVVKGHDFPLDEQTWYRSLQKAGYHTIAVGKDDLTKSMRGTFPNGTRHAAELGFDAVYRMQGKFATFAFPKPWDQFGETLQNERCGRNESGYSNLRMCNRWCYGVYMGSSNGVGKCCHDVAGGGWNCPGLDQVGPNQQLYMDDLVTSKAEALLDAVPAGKPWALHISFPGPHPPFIITEGMNKSVENRSFPVSFDNAGVSREEQRQIRRSYAAEIENLDRLFGRLLEKLEAMGAMDNTYVIVTSDHGEMLGDHNRFGKKVPWEASIRVPMIVSGPEVSRGRVVETPVSILSAVDFILGRAGAQKQDDWYQVPLPTSDSQEHPPIESGLSTEHSEFRAVIKRFNATHTMKLVCCPSGCPAGNSAVPSTAPDPQALAFNVAADPEERFNLNGTAEALQLAAVLEDSYAALCLPSLGSSPAADGAGAGAEDKGATGSGEEEGDEEEKEQEQQEEDQEEDEEEEGEGAGAGAGAGADVEDEVRAFRISGGAGPLASTGGASGRIGWPSFGGAALAASGAGLLLLLIAGLAAPLLRWRPRRTALGSGAAGGRRTFERVATAEASALLPGDA